MNMVVSKLIMAGFMAVSLLAGCAHERQNSVPEIHSEVRGAQAPTVVFINGNGAALEVWDTVEQEVFDLGYQTFKSDREGFGKSALGARPYSIHNELAALTSALAKNNLNGDKLIVAHSYGGLLAAMLADTDETVIGVVLVDALIPSEMTPEYTQSVLEQYQPQYPALREQAPLVAAAIIPVIDGYPKTVSDLANLTWPSQLPIISIRASQSTDPENRQRIAAQAHQNLIAADPDFRTLMQAAESGHQVMRDQPEIVVEAITKLLKP